MFLCISRKEVPSASAYHFRKRDENNKNVTRWPEGELANKGWNEPDTWRADRRTEKSWISSWATAIFISRRNHNTTVILLFPLFFRIYPAISRLLSVLSRSFHQLINIWQSRGHDINIRVHYLTLICSLSLYVIIDREMKNQYNACVNEKLSNGDIEEKIYNILYLTRGKSKHNTQLNQCSPETLNGNT